MKQQTKRISTQTLTFGAILTALVVILQFLAIFLRGFLPFALSLVLVPVDYRSGQVRPLYGGVARSGFRRGCIAQRGRGVLLMQSIRLARC